MGSSFDLSPPMGHTTYNTPNTLYWDTESARMNDRGSKGPLTEHAIIFGCSRKRSANNEQVDHLSPYKIQRSSLAQDMPSAYRLRKLRSEFQKQQAMTAFGKNRASKFAARSMRRTPSRSEVRSLRPEIERRRSETKEERKRADGLNAQLVLARYQNEANAKETQERWRALEEFAKIKGWAAVTADTAVFQTIEKEVERLKEENAKLKEENMACRRELEDARRASTSRDILINQEQQTVLHLKGDVDQLKSQLVEKDQRLHGLEDQVQHLQEQSLNHTSQRYEDSDKMSDWSMNAAGGSSSSQHSIAGDEEEDGEGEGEGEEEEEEGEDGEEEKTDELLDHPSVHDANSDKHAQRGPYYQSNPQSEESSAGLDDEEIDEFLASLSGGEEEKSVYALVEEESTLLMLPDEHLSRVEQVEQLRRMDSEVVTVALAHAFTAKTFNNIWNLRKWPLIKSNRWTLNRRLMLDAVEAVKRSPEFNNVLKWLPQPDSRCSRERKLQMLDAIMPKDSLEDAEDDEELADFMNETNLAGTAD